MRVIAGAARGMHLTAPRGTTTRPTSDRVKEALFSMLTSAEQLDQAQVLDLFAGSGALGIEALSRGASHVVFVEKDRAALEVLHKNLSLTGFQDQSQILAMDCLQALKRLQHQQQRFTLILMDPPYKADNHKQIIELLSDNLLTLDGVLVVEVASRSSLPERVGSCIRTDRRVYGDTALEFFSVESHHAP